MGSGKSTVLAAAQKMIPVTDCDAINARLLEPGNRGYEALKQKGLLKTLPDGQADKQALAQIFKDPDLKREVEGILHPLILEEMKAWMESQNGLCMVEVPLLFEMSLEGWFDQTWMVYADEDVALQRLQEQRHIPEDEARRRLALQMSVEDKKKRADVCLANNKSREELEQQVTSRLKALLEETS